MSRNAPGRRPTRVLSTLAATAALLGLAAGPAQAVQPNAGDLDFILEQYDRSQPHALSGNAADLRAQVPQAELPYGLRTVKGELNNLIPGREQFGAADQVMPRLLQKTFRAGDAGFSYSIPGAFVRDSQPRQISNLISDQSANNPAAVAAAGANPESKNGSLSILNTAPDAGLSARYNSWFTLFGQFFDHGLDLVTKGGGSVQIPVHPGDELYQANGANFMPMSRAKNFNADGTPSTGAGREHMNTTTSFVDQNQTYTSHPSHQVFLREYELRGGVPVATGRLLNGQNGGLPTWADVKAQAQDLLGITLTDMDVLNVPVVETDAYGKFIPGANGKPTLTGQKTNHAFLDDIAHAAAPSTTQAYDAALLNSHFITGDGRGNENIGLTAVHHVFHEEHNLRVDEIKQLINNSTGDPDPADWKIGGADGAWDGEKLFQAARFVTEMEYQHLVFEEFARKVQPQVNVFASYEDDVDPAIVAEFAHTVYRFGHSMLTEEVARKDADGTTTNVDLIDAFLNPRSFHESPTQSSKAAAGSIVRGMTSQVGNEIDEFVTGALRNRLVGLPLDLAAINIARGRDTGVPTLNAARREFYNATVHSALKPYESWTDFGMAIRHPESLVNFVAAYGTHQSVRDAVGLNAKRAAAELLVNGGTGAPADREAFMQSTGTYANLDTGETTTGVDAIDFWMGGLAEKQMPFGGMLGSTFNFVFETQMEKLQDGDRMYYLGRVAGLNFLTELEQNSFAEMIRRTTDAKHLPADVFSTPDYTFEVGPLGTSGPVQDDGTTPYDESTLLTRMPNGTIRFGGAEHVVWGGTEGNNRIHSSEGDDTVWGDGGDDNVEGGAGNDSLNGGEDNDILTDAFGDDNIKGGGGDDAINAGSGLDLIIGGPGKDFVVAGSDPKETFGGEGDDFVVAGDAADTVVAGGGNDWIEGGAQGDVLQAEHADPFENGEEGDEVLIGGAGVDDNHAEGGDDVIVSGSGSDFNEGMLGFDWVTHRGDPRAADADLKLTGLLPPDENDLRDRFTRVEALSGWNHDDKLYGDDSSAAGEESLTQRGLGLIGGIGDLLAPGATGFTGGNILLGGGGSDSIEGRGGNDLIDGDSWLDVYISVRDVNDPTKELRRADSMAAIQADVFAGKIKPSQLKVVREIKRAPAGAETDTVVFSGPSTAYQISSLTGPRIQVTHLNGGIDGVDTVVNAEVLKFTDKSLTVNRSAPTGTLDITGTPKEDVKLTATRNFADLDGVGVVSYAWEAETATNVWTKVGDGAEFTPGDDQVGKRLRAVATYTDGRGADERVESAATAAVENVNDTPGGAVTLSSTAAEVRQRIDVTDTLTDADGLGPITYHWQAQSATGWDELATGASFTPRVADIGKVLRVVARYTDGHTTNEEVASVETAAVIPSRNTPATGAVTITGTPREDLALTASNTIADVDGIAGTITYRWQSKLPAEPDTAWQNAGTGASFTPRDAEVGKVLRVRAEFNDNLGNPETVTSAATAVVGNVNDPATGTPLLRMNSTTAVVGTQLSVNLNPIQDLDGLPPLSGFRYQWQQGESNNRWRNITGATGSTYTLTRNDRGRPVRVNVLWNDVRTTTLVEQRASNATANVTEGALVPAPVTQAATTQTQTQTLASTTGLVAPTSPAPRTTTRIASLSVPSVLSTNSEQPITVSGAVPEGADTVRIRVFRLSNGATQAKVKKLRGKLVSTVYRRAPRGKKYTFRLTERKLRNLAAGRYLVEVRVGTDRRTLGPAVTRRVVVRKRQAK